MLGLNFKKVRRVLFVGAHSDDIEIGCGGTILRLAEECPKAHVSWVVLGGGGVRRLEAENSAAAFLSKHRHRRISVRDFKVSYFPFQGEKLKEYIESLKEFRPDLVFTHYRHDLHQDHRFVSELTWNCFRNQQILEYEIPKYDGDLGAPNFYVPIRRELLNAKCVLLRRHFRSQATKRWFTRDLFHAVARIRGMECNAPSRFAEAFYSRKLVLD
jgi:LmbE family N-acetylglucosaminyl deacetylase